MHLYLVCDERYWNLKLTNFSEKRPKYRAPIVISATGEKVKWVKLNVILTKTEAVLAPGYFSHHLGSGVQEQASCQQSTQQSKRYFLYKNEFIKVHFLIILAKNYLKVLFFDLYPWQGGTVELCCVSITVHSFFVSLFKTFGNLLLNHDTHIIQLVTSSGSVIALHFGFQWFLYFQSTV